MVSYSFLQPLQVGSKTMKNRISLSAMIKHLCTEDGFITDEYVAYYGTRAKGGAGMIVPGAMVIDPDWPVIFYRQPWLNDDKYIPGLQRAIDIVKAEGSLFVCQLWHPGMGYDAAGNQMGKSVNALTHDEIRQIQQLYLDAARRCKKAGADGVEFHCAHGFLPNQFLSPYFNQRTDQYGSDTVENATRFSVEILEKIRDELVDDQFILTAKINGDDFAEDGVHPAWAAQAGALMERAGVCMITVNGGGSITSVVGMSDDGRQPEGWKVPFAAEMKKHVSIPVAANGSLRHPEFINEALKAGQFDIASIGRGLLAEPDWVVKTTFSRENEIRYCISCMFCFNTSLTDDHSGCSVNPYACKELTQRDLPQDGEGHRVVVVGAGPAGLEAAVTLAERNFLPAIYEAAPDIGGQLALAARAPGKGKFAWHVNYYRDQIDCLDIQVNTGTTLTAEEVLALEPYAVIVATGSVEKTPDVEGLDLPHVTDARSVLASGTIPTGKKVVVLGGGLAGLETARFLNENGNTVTVLELEQTPAANMETRLAMGDCQARGIPVLTGHRVLRVQGNTVHALRLADEEELTFPAELVVRAFGMVPNDGLYEQLKAKMERVYKVGDCINPGKLYFAVENGRKTAIEVPGLPPSPTPQYSPFGM